MHAIAPTHANALVPRTRFTNYFPSLLRIPGAPGALTSLAFEECRREAERGLPAAQARLASMLYLGEGAEAMLDPAEALRVVVSAPGAVSFVLWVWQPAVTRLQVTAHDRENADHLRMMASALNLAFTDLLLISPCDRVSLAVMDQWV